MGSGWRRAILVTAVWAASLAAADFRVYVGQITSDSVLIAWGLTSGPGNTIGRSSASHGKAVVRAGTRSVSVETNWALIGGLPPDRELPYAVTLNGRLIGEGSVRTYPIAPERLTFLVHGDWGSGDKQQARIAEAMWTEIESRKDPVRFILTTGDNIYANTFMGIPTGGHGDQDSHWEKKFFAPYQRLLRRIPFYPSPGNHDGNQSERHGDLPVYLDNFFFPGNQPSRFYQFRFGDLAEFYSLDSTQNTLDGAPSPYYKADGEQSRWLSQALRESKARWKIPYFHHPPFTAGPEHPAMLPELDHWVKLFSSAGVKVVFNGHEHNFQVSRRDRGTGGVCYVISGAGGQLRGGDVAGRLNQSGIAGWAATSHFLVVEIDREAIRITPVGADGSPIRVTGGSGASMPLPIVVN